MLYIVEIEVPQKPTWGHVIQKTINIPSKVHRVKSLCFFAVLGKEYERKDASSVADTKAFIPDRNRKKVESSQGGISVEWNDFYSIQIGNVSVSINNTLPIRAGSPIVALNMLRGISDATNLRFDQTYNSNKVELSEPIELKGGSTMNIVIEESDLSPSLKNSGYHPMENGKDYNKYTVKVYIEYDK